MRRLLHYAKLLTNGCLAMVDARVVSGGISKPRHHPQSPDILHQRVFPAATYAPWLSDVEFVRCYAQIKNNTLVDLYRCYELWQLGNQLASVPGDFLEVGVWRGGTGCLLAKTAQGRDKHVFLADTFTGVVKTSGKDTTYTGGEHSDTSEEIVLQLAHAMSLDNVSLLKGIFPQDTGARVPGSIALLHCDVDVYDSAKDIVNWAIPRLSPGAVIVFDDYGFGGCEGITRFVNDLRSMGQFRFVHNLNGHALLVNCGR
jgi:O-methyltransferase